jgi:hypothetical protein
LEDENSEPDPYIGLLNQDLIMIEEIITISLSPRRAKYIILLVLTLKDLFLKD